MKPKTKETLKIIIVCIISYLIGLQILYYSGCIYFAGIAALAIFCTWYTVRAKIKEKSQKDPSNHTLDEASNNENT